MIKSVHLKNVATFQDEDFCPSKLNIVYGANGSGKTTLSREMAKPNNANISWEGTPAKVLVYNQDFIEENFLNTEDIPGIFTLGRDAKEVEEYIKESRLKINDLKLKIEENVNKQNDLQQRIDQLHNDYLNDFWKAMKLYDNKFKRAFQGVRSDKNICMKKIIDNYKENKKNIFEEDELKRRYDSIYNEEPKEYEEYTQVDDSILEIESDSIWETPIEGNKNSNLKSLINTLHNNDWVLSGIQYLNEESELCPFCQQKLTVAIQKELHSLFDDTLTKIMNKVKNYKDNYNRLKQNLFIQCEQILNNKYPICNYLSFETIYKTLKLKLNGNWSQIEHKINNPSTIIKLESVRDELSRLKQEIIQFNNSILQNNKIVQNLNQERKKFLIDFWSYFASDYVGEKVESFNKVFDGMNKNMTELKLKNDGFNKEIKLINDSIKEKQKGINSIDNAIGEINKLLRGFSFTNFQIEKASNNKYKLIRPDGSCVGKTLSEGEYRFITFLYFYEFIQGNIKPEEVSGDKVIVIDDPISSLDSSIVFIVSILVRNILRLCKNNENDFKQVIVCTHNKYFHEEIAYELKSKSQNRDIKYHIIRKENEKSKIISNNENQITTTYKSLWKEVKSLNPTTCFNAMRRILEEYFALIGRDKYTDAINNLDLEEQKLCRALIPFINTGSHKIFNDLYLTFDITDIEKYKAIFKKIFEINSQIDHYNAMMGEE